MWPLSSSSSSTSAALTILLVLLPLILLPFLPSTHAFNLLSLSRQPQPLQERAAQPYQQQYDEPAESSSSSSNTNQGLGLLDRLPTRTRTLENIRCPHCLSVDDEIFVLSPPPLPSPPSSSARGGAARRREDGSSMWVSHEGEEGGGREAWRPSPGIIPSHLSTHEFTRRLYRDKPWMKRM